MKVLSLQCDHQHSFEGWFGSEDDFQSQLARGLVECPMCASKAIVKMPSAPRLNFGGHREPIESLPAASEPVPTSVTASGSGSDAASGTPSVPALAVSGEASPTHEQQSAFFKALRHVVANTEDVGDRFANQARAMHYGDIEPRSIRGQATQREAAELIDEGINVMALPMPAALKETLQ